MPKFGNYKGQHKPWKDEEILRREYEKGHTQAELGEKWGCTHKTITYWMDKFGIEARDRSDYARDHMRFHTSLRGYEVWQSTSKDHDRYRVHRLLAVAEFGVEAVEGMEVHHENGISWDNRPENIKLTEKAAHAKTHDETRERDEFGRYC